MIFSGLRSLWMMLFSWRCSTASIRHPIKNCACSLLQEPIYLRMSKKSIPWAWFVRKNKCSGSSNVRYSFAMNGLSAMLRTSFSLRMKFWRLSWRTYLFLKHLIVYILFTRSSTSYISSYCVSLIFSRTKKLLSVNFWRYSFLFFEIYFFKFE